MSKEQRRGALAANEWITVQLSQADLDRWFSAQRSQGEQSALLAYRERFGREAFIAHPAFRAGSDSDSDSSQ